MTQGPLSGIRILDFSGLVPGPFATLMFARTGADVIKVERPPHGDEMRNMPAQFEMLNAGKRSLFVDLKNADDRKRLMPLIRTADIVIEQFRPGAMARLGLDAETLRAENPRLIYCSINGYGSTGPDVLRAGHDLTYAAETGLLMQVTGSDGAPVMPHAMLADIGGGTYPAVINILMALFQRERTGEGATIEIAMADNLRPFLFPAYASAFGDGVWPQPNGAVETGSSPRYNLYRAADGRWIAAAPVEEKFWSAFCEAIELPAELISSADADAVKAGIAERIGSRSSAEWMARFEGRDAACALVMSFEEAMAREGCDRHVTPVAALPIISAFAACGAASAPALADVQAADWR